MRTLGLRRSYWILTVISAVAVFGIVKLQLRGKPVYHYVFVSHGTPDTHQLSSLKQRSDRVQSVAWRAQNSNANIFIKEQGTPRRQCARRGYVMALSYHDQVTCASGRVAVLQCWAHKYRMSVVEPFLPSNSSFPGMPHPGEPVSQSLRFGDMFDMKEWNRAIQGYTYRNQTLQFSPSATWEEFINCAPRETIVVQNLHKEREPYSYPCTYPRIQTHFESVFAPHGFQIVKWVCINMADYGLLTLDTFKRLVFGSFDSRKVTLLFDQWRGIFDEMSVYASNVSITMASSCTNAAVRDAILKYFIPSKRVLSDVEKYEEQYLGGQSYTSVMIRLERVISCSPDHGPKAIERITSLLSELRRNSSAPVFLSTDVGSFGSQTYSDHDITPRLTIDYTEMVLDSLYGEKATSIEEYEQRFMNVSYSSNPAYISTLQKTLSARGQCMYMFGGGGFQRQAEFWYRFLYHAQEKRCIYATDRSLCSIRNTITPWQTWRIE